MNLFGCNNQTTKNNTRQKNKKIETHVTKLLKDFDERVIHNKLTRKIIDSTPTSNLEQVIIDNIYLKIIPDSSNDEKQFETIISLSKGRQAIFATIGLENEVNNGGYNQYFYNFSSSGQYGELAREGFSLIGAKDFSKITQSAIDTLLKNAKHLSKFKDGTLESFSKSYENNPLNKFDDIFFELEKNINLSELRIKYILDHKSEFIDK